jgi:hypothetical protein
MVTFKEWGNMRDWTEKQWKDYTKERERHSKALRSKPLEHKMTTIPRGGSMHIKCSCGFGYVFGGDE